MTIDPVRARISWGPGVAGRSRQGHARQALHSTFHGVAKGGCYAGTRTGTAFMTALRRDGNIAPIGSDRADVPAAWKSIILGNCPTVLALHQALVEKGIAIGDLAGQMLRLPPFTLAPAVVGIDLSIVTFSQLGLGSDHASFAEIHARATEAGLALCPAEVGPQLRLQYPDQKVGEYLLIGMKPLPTADGSDACFIVGNGGAGLLLIGRFAAADLTVSSRARFVFALSR